ncbi:MAG: response regulator [Chloroflexi bacterium]|nr:response regulator [Chloroflexota bacterium]
MPESYRVLIVEDEFEQAEMYTEFLRVSGPYTTEWVSNLRALWERLPREQFHVMLLDYRLPDGNGLKVLEEMHGRGYDLPVIMITGQGDERLAVRAMQAGAADYMVKGSDEMLKLPTLVQKVIRNHELQLSVQRSLEQIRYQATLLNNVRDAVVVWDAQGKITYWNPAAAALYGWSARERMGAPARETYFGEFTPPVSEPPREGTTGMEVERRFRSRRGGDQWVSSRVCALRDPGADGRVLGYMDVARDITQRKQMEQQILDAQNRLTQAARLAAIGELASGVAHHINNPLTTIIAEAQLLLHNLDSSSPARESAEAIEEAGWRVQKAVQLLIEFARPASNTLESLAVNATIENALALVGEQIRSNGVLLLAELAAGLPAIHGNARQLGDLWVNLLLLARDAVSDGAAHTIRVRSSLASPRQIKVEVSDDGRPIPREEMATLFEPNLIAPLGGRGTGMEMNICQEIVRQHQGRIEAKSEPGQGTTFSVYFPVEVSRE